MGSPIWANKDAAAVIKLMNNGMDLFQREPLKNGTVLHYWAGTPFNYHNSNQKDSLAVVKLLIEIGGDLLAVNSWDFTPLLEAATGRNGEYPNLVVFDFLIERDEYSRVNKIEAMELAGAVILGHVPYRYLLNKAFDYWRRALQLRQMDTEEHGPIQKTRMNLETIRTIEWNTSAELEDIINTHGDTYMIQSFLVRLRIFYYKSWEALESLFRFYTGGLSFIQLRMSKSSVEIFEVIWAMLETVCRFDSCEKSGLQWLTERIIYKLIKVYSSLERQSPNLWSLEIVKMSLELVVSATGLHQVEFHPLIQLVKILFHLPSMLNEGALKILSELRDHSGKNLLHVACNNDSERYKDIFSTIRPVSYLTLDAIPTLSMEMETHLFTIWHNLTNKS